MKRLERLPLLALGMGALLAALWGGLLRLGWSLPAVQPALVPGHGPLMVCGFLGTVIGLERAVALGRSWGYAAPLCSAVSVAVFLAGLPWQAGAAAATAAGIVFTAVTVVLALRQLSLPALVMAAGAAAWAGGDILWLHQGSVYRIVLWWQAFLILTIAGERLQLSKLLNLTPFKRNLFLAGSGLLAAGTAGVYWFPGAGTRVAGAGMVCLSLWLAFHDIARRTVREKGLTRFMALSLLAGYAWLAAGGALALWQGMIPAGPLYDAMLHSVFVGFVMSMIFGHAPVIFPAILLVTVRFRPRFYGHLALLHLSLALRVSGDLSGSTLLRQWGGLLNAAAILVFLANTAAAVGRPASGSANQ